MEFLIVLAILGIVVLVVSAPLRRARAEHGAAGEAAGDEAAWRFTELANLEAAREAKYREIRDAELDHRTGKLSDSDFEAIDRALRAEAIEILQSIDRSGGSTAG